MKTEANNDIVDENITLLTPGSVWQRSSGAKSTACFITNLHLSERQQISNPPVVTFFDDEGNACSMSLEKFFETRTFYNVNGELEAAIDSVLSLVGLPESDEESDDDAELMSDASLLEEVSQAMTAGIGAAPTTIISFSASAPDNLQPIAAAISGAVVGYRQRPNVSEGTVEHVIDFDRMALNNLGLDYDSLSALFDPEAANGFLPNFAHTESGESITVDWSMFLGAFYEVRAYHNNVQQLVSLYFGTDNEAALDRKIADVLAQPVTEAVAVAPAAAPVVDVVVEAAVAPAAAAAPAAPAAPAVVVG